MTQPIILRSTSPTDAVADALYRAVIGLDNNDHKLWNSAWVEGNDMTFAMGDNVMDSRETIETNIFKPIGALVTHHNISNVRVDLESRAETAYMTCYAIAQHKRPDTGLDPKAAKLTSGATYAVDVVKDCGDGLWKLRKWSMQLVWLEGDASIVGM